MRLNLLSLRRALPLARGSWLGAVEIALVAALGVQCARLTWAVVTPIGVFGDWRARPVIVMSPLARAALFAGFDPFYRTQPAQTASQSVTALSLQLFGTRVNQASGGGSAIIAGPDGAQASYAIGDEIIAGVTLKAVADDHVVLSHGGNDELLFLDQSKPAAIVQPSGTATVAAATPPAALTVERIRSEIGLVPRIGANGAVTGIAVAPTGSGAAFPQLGFQAGDVIVTFNGRPIRSSSDVQALSQSLTPGARVSLQVERGASIVPLALVLPN